jgi:hypothetical protein
MSALTSAIRLSVGLLLAAGLLQSCVDPDARLRQLASPHVSCSEDELRFVEGRGNAHSAVYVVECEGAQRYRCISRARPFGDEPDTVCSPEATATLDMPEYEP